MSTGKKRKGWRIAAAVVVVLGLVAFAAAVGCGEKSEVTTTTWAAAGVSTTAGAVATTAAPATTVWNGTSDEESGDSAGSPSYGVDQAQAATLTALQAASGPKVIKDAQLEIEVESGKFQAVFDQAMLIAVRYGGYLVSSNSYASGEEDAMKSGTVAVRVPSNSFEQALSDAGKLGTLKSQTLASQDVTADYVDLEARIKNSEAYVNSMMALLAQAKTIDDILNVQSVLTYAQQELEQLKGQMRYLQEHTSYSTITMNIYEAGTEPEPVVTSEWGVGRAFKDALHYLVRVFNGIVKALGVLVPILIVLGIIAYIVYRIVRAVSRRNKQREQMRYQPHPEGAWRQGPVGGAGPGGPGFQPGAPSQPEVTPSGQTVSRGEGAAQSGAPEEQGRGK